MDCRSYRLCVFILIIIIYRCAAGYFEKEPVEWYCEPCYVWCLTCTMKMIKVFNEEGVESGGYSKKKCEACAADSNRVVATILESYFCAYLFW